MDWKKTFRTKRTIIEGSIGGLLILLSLPAIARALTAFDHRVLIGLFLFLIAFIIVRDPQAAARVSDLFHRRSENNGK